MSSAGLTVYGNIFSTCTQKVLLAASEKQVKLNLTTVNLMAGEHKQAAHLARQPFGKIPAIHDSSSGFSLYESRAIVRYLDDKFSTGNRLVPAAPESHAVFEQWASLEATTFSADISQICMSRVWGPMRGLKPDAEAAEAAAKRLAFPFDVLNKQLEGKEFIVGDYSAVDIFFIPYLRLISKTPESHLVSSRPNVAAWWQRVGDRASFKEVYAQVDEAAAAFQKK